LNVPPNHAQEWTVEASELCSKRVVMTRTTLKTDILNDAISDDEEN
jgi:hypothetical protein